MVGLAGPTSEFEHMFDSKSLWERYAPLGRMLAALTCEQMHAVQQTIRTRTRARELRSQGFRSTDWILRLLLPQLRREHKHRAYVRHSGSYAALCSRGEKNLDPRSFVPRHAEERALVSTCCLVPPHSSW